MRYPAFISLIPADKDEVNTEYGEGGMYRVCLFLCEKYSDTLILLNRFTLVLIAKDLLTDLRYPFSNLQWRCDMTHQKSCDRNYVLKQSVRVAK